LGADMMSSIASKRVIVFGVGGVGSWCAESLVRSGIRDLTIVDSDRVCVTNINRQLLATTKTVGKVKVDVLKERLLEINPSATITAIQAIYSEETSDSFHLDTYDYIVDAIDSLRDKAHLILAATRTRAVLFSSMGAALKLDPTRISVAEFWKVRGCPLAAALRRRFKHAHTFPARKFQCVYSEELFSNRGESKSLSAEPSLSLSAESALPLSAESADRNVALINPVGSSPKAHVNGSVVHATAIFGFMISGLIVQHILRS